jgi:hypothetical protein
MNPEKALFQAFAVPNKRQRYINLLDSNGGREKIRLSLDHFKDLDPRFARRVNPGEQNLIDLLRILRGLGAPAACHVISSDKKLDGHEMGLVEALSAVIGRGFGTFLSCVPGELAYFEGEELRERYICCREPFANQSHEAAAKR